MPSTNRVSLEVSTRELIRKGYTRALRRLGLVPAVLHKESEVAIPISLKASLIKNLENGQIFELLIQGSQRKVLALVQDIQYNPVNGGLQHIDFVRVREEENVKIRVPLTFANKDKSPGIRKGGILKVLVPSLYISCLVKDLQESLTVDLEGLDIGSSIHLEAVQLNGRITLISPKRSEGIIAVIIPPQAKQGVSDKIL